MRVETRRGYCNLFIQDLKMREYINYETHPK